ncbi:MAG: ClpXP protease specificity-enhancing factor SspB [Pseudomonadota bacterium]
MTDFSPETIAYGRLMHQAMRGLIRRVLGDVARDGLPGEHHFFITFDTQAEGVDLANWLIDRYPEEMTIVIQHWYDNLAVDDSGFDVTLNFGDRPEPLRIPFDAILTFVDPSVEFGLRFETRADADDDDPDGNPTPPPEPNGPDNDEVEPDHDAEIVSLDKFRKGN